MLSQALGCVVIALVFATFWMNVPIRLPQVAPRNVASIARRGRSSACDRRSSARSHTAQRVAARGVAARTAKIKQALVTDLSMDWLKPMMQMHVGPGAGEFLFRQGDEQGDIYLVVSGTIRLIEIDVTVGAGELIGEMAVFSPASRRTLSARCETPVELLVMPTSEFLKRTYQNPDFGVYLVRLVEGRLLQNVELVRQIGVERDEQVKRLRKLAKIDETTGLGDRDAIKARLVAEWSRGGRTSSPLTLLTVRVQAIRSAISSSAQVGAALSWCISRATDFLGRDGGNLSRSARHRFGRRGSPRRRSTTRWSRWCCPCTFASVRRPEMARRRPVVSAGPGPRNERSPPECLKKRLAGRILSLDTFGRANLSLGRKPNCHVITVRVTFALPNLVRALANGLFEVGFTGDRPMEVALGMRAVFALENFIVGRAQAGHQRRVDAGV